MNKTYVIQTHYVPFGSYDGFNLVVSTTDVTTIAWQLISDLNKIHDFYTKEIGMYMDGSKVFLDAGNVLEKNSMVKEVHRVIGLSLDKTLAYAKDIYIKSIYLYMDSYDDSGDRYIPQLVLMYYDTPDAFNKESIFWMDEIEKI